MLDEIVKLTHHDRTPSQNAEYEIQLKITFADETSQNINTLTHYMQIPNSSSVGESTETPAHTPLFFRQ